MNSPTHYIVYGSIDAMRGDDPAHVYRCSSIGQALSVAYKHKVDPATHIIQAVSDRHTVFFTNLDELCCDILRNRALHFAIKLDDFEGFMETIALSLNRSQLLSWILEHAAEFDEMHYVLNYKTMTGNYSVGNLGERYIIQELIEG